MRAKFEPSLVEHYRYLISEIIEEDSPFCLTHAITRAMKPWRKSKRAPGEETRLEEVGRARETLAQEEGQGRPWHKRKGTGDPGARETRAARENRKGTRPEKVGRGGETLAQEKKTPSHRPFFLLTILKPRVEWYKSSYA